MAGLFGLLPHWSQDAAITRVTYTARCEDVADKPAYRQVWHRAQLSSARNEKRMLGILPPERYLDWLDAPAEHSQDFIRAYPAQGLQVEWNTT